MGIVKSASVTGDTSVLLVRLDDQALAAMAVSPQKRNHKVDHLLRDNRPHSECIDA